MLRVRRGLSADGVSNPLSWFNAAGVCPPCNAGLELPVSAPSSSTAEVRRVSARDRRRDDPRRTLRASSAGGTTRVLYALLRTMDLSMTEKAAPRFIVRLRVATWRPQGSGVLLCGQKLRSEDLLSHLRLRL